MTHLINEKENKIIFSCTRVIKNPYNLFYIKVVLIAKMFKAVFCITLLVYNAALSCMNLQKYFTIVYQCLRSRKDVSSLVQCLTLKQLTLRQ